MNGNCVFIFKFIVKVVGNLDFNFVYSIGDIDYGLWVNKVGGLVWLVFGYVGICIINFLEIDIWEN